MNITIEQAKTLCALVDQNGYPAAAKKLNKSHSSLIYAIRNLESECGFEIFDRKEYRNKLTRKGEILYRKCQELLNKVHEIEQICQDVPTIWESQVSLIIDGILDFTPFLKLYEKLKEHKIPTHVQTLTDFLEGVENRFLKTQSDIMISLHESKLKGQACYPLKPIRISLVAHREHPLNINKKIWTTQELQEFLFLTVRQSGHDLNLGTTELEKGALVSLGDFSVKKEAILNKIGFGWLPEHMLKSNLAKKKLLPIRWERSSHQILQPRLYVRSQSLSGKTVQLIIKELT